MSTPSSRAPRRRSGRAVAARVVLLLFLLAAPAVTYAHGALRRAVPASKARLSAVPRALRLTFTERVELPVTRVTLAGPGGTPVALAPLATAPDSAHVVVAAIRGGLVAGAYTVTWQVAGRDGHPVRGRYTFSILPGATGITDAASGEPGAGLLATGPATDTGSARAAAGEAGAAVTAPGQEPPPDAHHSTSTLPDEASFDAESPAYVAVRWLTYAALLLVLGAVAFRVAVLGVMRRSSPDVALALAPDAARGAATLGLWGSAALLVSALARVGAQSVAMHGAADALDGASVGAMLRHTVWGWGWLVQVAGAATAAVAFARARRAGAARGDAGTAVAAWTVATLAALALAFTPALSGHAAAAPRLTALAILSDALHVVGAAGWLGSLLVVLAAGVPAAFALGAERRGRAVAVLVTSFSPTALAFAAVVAATGVFAAWLHVGRFAALWGTDYGRVLLLKLAVLSPVAATGAYNWLRVRPALGGDAGAARIRRSATAELAVGALVLLATAALVATPTAMEGSADDEAAAGGAPVAADR